MTSEKKRPTLLVWMSRVDAHHRLFISLLLAVGCYFLSSGHVLGKRLILSWDAFALGVLVLAWARILTAEPDAVLKTAKIQHSTRSWIFGFVLSAACASLVAVFYLLLTPNAQPELRHYAMALVTVVISWCLIHTVFALQYAYLYCCCRPAGKGPLLIFPDQEVVPDYCDFAYFSFVIGMTSQVSDVQIASRKVRRWALLHGLISFAFNLAVLGLGFNIISGILGNR